VWSAKAVESDAMKLFLTPEDIARKEKAVKTLMNCRICGREMSPNASTCPHCGEKYINEGRRFAFLVAFIIVFFLFLAIIASSI
jgi:predicted nucleic acid-binding Zn ribbon protein